MTFREYMKDHVVYFDGGFGTILQNEGLLPPGEFAENLYFTHSEVMRRINRDYYDAGSNVVSTCTFRVNALNFPKERIEPIVRTAIENAKIARDSSSGTQEKFIALEYGPIGKLLRPYGDLEFDEAVEMFAQIVRIGVQYGVDLIVLPTMNDCLESKAALLAAKENSDLPVLVSNTYGEDGKLMTGASPAAMVAMLESMGADIIGVNCAMGPKQMAPVIAELLRCASVPVFIKPNAGLPRSVGGKPVYDVMPDEFAEEITRQIRAGVRLAGGCCGTTPEHIRAMVECSRGLSPRPLTDKNISCISSYTHTVEFGADPILIGERINPTGKRRIKQALREHDIGYILSEGIAQQDKGVQVLDVNVGLPDIREPEMLETAVRELQNVTDLPLQIDTADPAAMEIALRYYNGKALINSVNGKAKNMAAIFPLVKKYGGMVVALTLDENGIPPTAAERLRIAKKILSTAAQYGIAKKDIIFDPLVLTVSADAGAADVTLEALRLIRDELGCHTSLGVSNVSFGLPARDVVNSAFFAAALENGLSAAIMNPDSADMMKTYHAFRVLHGLDQNCAAYIAFCVKNVPAKTAAAPAQEDGPTLQRAIIRGLKEQTGTLTRARLAAGVEPLEIIRGEVIPALDVVGKGFEEKTVYLPQLLMSAEAAKSAFEAVKASMVVSTVEKCIFVLATVQGDIHDIGKNIVRLLLENYGFAVHDLGIDVPVEKVVEAVRADHAPLVGLSALMTTTVPAMEETIRQLRRETPWCSIVVGGAVLNPECAAEIGADRYAKDAMETVRYAEAIDAFLHK